MFKKIFRSLKSAANGLIYCIKNERNMRIHTSIAFFVLVFSTFFNLSVEKYLILILTIFVVIGLEMINSAIELMLDSTNKKYDSSIKIIKDISAGAVLLSAIVSLIVAYHFFFSDFSVYLKIFSFFMHSPITFIGLLFLLILDFFYIAWGPAEIKNLLKRINVI